MFAFEVVVADVWRDLFSRFFDSSVFGHSEFVLDRSNAGLLNQLCVAEWKQRAGVQCRL